MDRNELQIIVWDLDETIIPWKMIMSEAQYDAMGDWKYNYMKKILEGVHDETEERCVCAREAGQRRAQHVSMHHVWERAIFKSSLIRHEWHAEQCVVAKNLRHMYATSDRKGGTSLMRMDEGSKSRAYIERIICAIRATRDSICHVVVSKSGLAHVHASLMAFGIPVHEMNVFSTNGKSKRDVFETIMGHRALLVGLRQSVASGLIGEGMMSIGDQDDDIQSAKSLKWPGYCQIKNSHCMADVLQFIEHELTLAVVI